MRRLAKAGIALGGSLLGVTGLIGLLHLPMARPLLAVFSGVPGCPVGADQVDPGAAEEFRGARAALRAGSELASSKRVLAFVLEQSTLADVERWATSHGASCERSRADRWVTCRNACGTEFGAVDDLQAQFDAKGRLVALDAVARHTDVTSATRAFTDSRGRLDAWLGHATAEHGSSREETLSLPLRQASSSHDYRDVIGKVSVTNLGARGFTVRTQVQSVPASTLAAR